MLGPVQSASFISLSPPLSVQGIQGPAGPPGEPGRDGLKVCLSNVLISCDANRVLLPPQPRCYSGPLPSSSSPPPAGKSQSPSLSLFGSPTPSDLSPHPHHARNATGTREALEQMCAKEHVSLIVSQGENERICHSKAMKSFLFL